MIIKFKHVIAGIYGLGVGISAIHITIYESYHRNIIIDKSIKNGKKINKYDDYAMNSFGGLIVHF